jgi:hypothetical protein
MSNSTKTMPHELTDQNATRRDIKRRQHQDARANAASKRRAGVPASKPEVDRTATWGTIKRGAVNASVLSPSVANAPARNTRKSGTASQRPSLSGEAARLAQQATAFRALNPVQGSYDEKIILLFMDQWLKASPVKANGVLIRTRTSLAIEAVRSGLPKVEGNSRQVRDLLSAAASAIRTASL